MRPLPIITVTALGLISSYLEFRNIKECTLFFIADIVEVIPLIILSLLTLIYLFKIIFSPTYKRFEYHTLLIGGSCFLVLIFGHMYIRGQNDASKTAFKAYNYNISDEGFILDFKENKHLKAQLIEKFSEKFYWGKYEKFGDTIELDLKTDFKLGKKAILKNDTMRIYNDSIYFLVGHQDSLRHESERDRLK
jgi:hypothetical protein